MGKKLVYGVGVNDANYVVETCIAGTRVRCPIYRTWNSMLNRCYSKGKNITRRTYKDCTVCEKWLTFSNFKSWMELQDWEGKELDKDFLSGNNKVYSPDTCVFITSDLNKFIIDGGNTTSGKELPLGVSWHKKHNLFYSRCRDPFTKSRKFLGYFDCPDKAHIAWKVFKHKLALQYADMQTDERLVHILQNKYRR